jgi:hypothetical protein
METFDLEQTSRLAALAATPPQRRDDAWCDRVLRAAPNASLTALNPQIQNGPDTFRYFHLALPDPGAFTPFSIVHVLQHALEAGAGAVIHVGLLAVPGLQGRSQSVLGSHAGESEGPPDFKGVAE